MNNVTAATSRKCLSGPALRTFFNIAKAWDLSPAQERVLLGNPARSTFFRWRAGQDDVELRNDTLERISYVLGIYQALHTLFPNVDLANGWVRCSNTAPGFNGFSALERMLGGQVVDLFAVREYLDAQRG